MKPCPANRLFKQLFGWARQWLMSSKITAIDVWPAILVALSVASGANAGTFSINPIRVELSRATQSEILHVSNSGSEDVTVQLQTMQWTQSEGEDKLKPTRDILATPQIFNLRAGASQIVRIGIAKKADPATEATYRLILEEIPPPPPPGFRGLQVALKMSLPVFIRPDGASEPSFDIRLAEQASGESGDIRLDLYNKGLTHVQLTGIKVYSASTQDEPIAVFDKNTYLLSGQKRQIRLKTRSNVSLPDAILIRAETRTGKTEFHAKSGAP